MRSQLKPTPSPRLPWSLKPRDQAPIATLDEACAYMLALPNREATANYWNHAAGLAITARDNPSAVTLEQFTRQFELALFLTWRMDLAADTLNGRKPPAPSALRRR